MYRLVIVPVIIGILAFLFTYFGLPAIISAPDIISAVASPALDSSNLYFATMPPIVANYIASLNLAMVALTVGFLITVASLLLVTIGGLFVSITRWLISHLQRDRKKEVAPDLPSLDMGPGFRSSQAPERILGRGLDSIQRD